ncbi:mitochondrial glutathione transporter SLC25A40-like [Tachypleus tridentatus]|uniref:mitochondrial glutathione transporter SLC25A40-like n=1 Tax=Tachypleus tridentatus TaxID=6853 RepID=UPI003FCF387F
MSVNPENRVDRRDSDDADINLNNDLTPLERMISSCSGAVITSLFVTPLDVVKIRLQAQQKEFMRNKCFLYCNGLMEHLCFCGNGNSNGNGPVTSPYWYRRPGHFTGTLDAFVKITRTEGLGSLWSGLPPTLVMAVPATVIYFTLYDQFRDYLVRNFTAPNQPVWVPMLSGATARVIGVTVISPLELIRTKMQSKKLSYFEIGKVVRNLVQVQGYLSLWRGLESTILRDVPFSSIYWASYEQIKIRFQREQPGFWFSFSAGATAGTVAAVLTLPFDVVKTHRQIELGEMEILAKNSNKQLTSTYSILRNLYCQRGFKALFAGIVPRVVKIAPACAIMISIYEFGKSFFRQHNNVHHGVQAH